MKKTICLIAITGAVLASCSRSAKSDAIILTTELNMENRVLNYENTKTENNAHGGKYYSSVDSVQGFAIGYSYVLPDSLKNKNMTVYVHAWVRESVAPAEGGIAVALNTTKGTVEWNELKVKAGTPFKANEWVLINDSLTYPSSKINDPYVEIGVVGLKSKGKDRFDIDDVIIKYKFTK